VKEKTGLLIPEAGNCQFSKTISKSIFSAFYCIDKNGINTQMIVQMAKKAILKKSATWFTRHHDLVKTFCYLQKELRGFLFGLNAVRSPILYYNLGYIASKLNKVNEASEYLNKAYEAFSKGSYQQLGHRIANDIKQLQNR